MSFLLLTHMWELNNTLLNNQWAKKEIIREIRNYLKRNENEHTTYQNLWNAARAILGEKLIVISANTQNKFSNNLTLYLRELGRKKLRTYWFLGIYLFSLTLIFLVLHALFPFSRSTLSRRNIVWATITSYLCNFKFSNSHIFTNRWILYFKPNISEILFQHIINILNFNKVFYLFFCIKPLIPVCILHVTTHV